MRCGSGQGEGESHCLPLWGAAGARRRQPLLAAVKAEIARRPKWGGACPTCRRKRGVQPRGWLPGVCVRVVQLEVLLDLALFLFYGSVA